MNTSNRIHLSMVPKNGEGYIKYSAIASTYVRRLVAAEELQKNCSRSSGSWDGTGVAMTHSGSMKIN